MVSSGFSEYPPCHNGKEHVSGWTRNKKTWWEDLKIMADLQVGLDVFVNKYKKKVIVIPRVFLAGRVLQIGDEGGEG